MAPAGKLRSLWLVAVLTSVVLLALVLLQVDWVAVRQLIAAAPPLLLLGGLAALGLEGVFTALRIRVFAPPGTRMASCFTATAWFVLWLVVLPARLGEVAAVGLLCRHTGMRAGPAAAGLVLQRLLDLAVLCAVFLLLAVVWVAPPSMGSLVAWVAALLVSVLAVGWWLSWPLGLLASALCSWRSARGVRRRVLCLVLGARTYHRHRLTRDLAVRSTLWTLAKWMSHLTAFTLLLTALDVPLTVAQCVFVGAGYNCLAVIPLQTVGGVGVGELGLAGMLALFELPLGQAAGIALLVRVALVAAPVLFWAVVVAGVRSRPMAPEVAAT